MNLCIRFVHIQVLWKSSPLPSDASHVVIATGSIHPEMLSPPGSPVTRKYLSQNEVFAGGLHWPLGIRTFTKLKSPGSSKSPAKRSKKLSNYQRTKHHANLGN